MRERLHNTNTAGTAIALVSAPPATRALDAGDGYPPGPSLSSPSSPSSHDERLARDLARIKRRLATAAPREDRLHRLLARVGDQLIMVELELVDWIEAADYFVCLHVGAASHLVRRTLDGIEHQLDPTRFFRLDRFAIVNLAHVAEVRPDGRGEPTAVLANGTMLRMGRGRLEALRRRLATDAAVRRRA